MLLLHEFVDSAGQNFDHCSDELRIISTYKRIETRKQKNIDSESVRKLIIQTVSLLPNTIESELDAI